MFDFSELYENLGRFPDQLEKALMQYAKTAAAKLHGQAVRDRPWTDRTAQARQRVKNLLAQGDRLTRERTVEEIWGADEVVSGILLQFQPNSYGVTGVQRVTGVTHRYGHPHLMSLTVEAWPDSRAAGSNDTITV